ncbi:MAG: hypothetical protein IPK03_06455 [Bacteroidetes bacterium]|nr:hypothetical protein [Bacteroidota bacterium]
MKTISRLLSVILIATYITSCQKVTESEITNTQNAAFGIQIVDDILRVVGQGIETGIVGDLKKESRTGIDGGIVTKDSMNQIITIDFPDEYMGTRSGHKFKGKVFVKYNDVDFYDEGFRGEVTFEDFTINGNSLNTLNGVPLLIETIANGSAQKTWTFRNEIDAASIGLIFKFEVETSVMSGFETPEFLDDVFHTKGSIHLDDARNGVYESYNIIETLIKNNDCVFISKGVIKNDNFGSIDFGDGICDEYVYLTIGSGSPYQVAIK